MPSAAWLDLPRLGSVAFKNRSVDGGRGFLPTKLFSKSSYWTTPHSANTPINGPLIAADLNYPNPSTLAVCLFHIFPVFSFQVLLHLLVALCAFSIRKTALIRTEITPALMIAFPQCCTSILSLTEIRNVTSMTRFFRWNIEVIKERRFIRQSSWFIKQTGWGNKK